MELVKNTTVSKVSRWRLLFLVHPINVDLQLRIVPGYFLLHFKGRFLIELQVHVWLVYKLAVYCVLELVVAQAVCLNCWWSFFRKVQRFVGFSLWFLLFGGEEACRFEDFLEFFWEELFAFFPCWLLAFLVCREGGSVVLQGGGVELLFSDEIQINGVS